MPRYPGLRSWRKAVLNLVTIESLREPSTASPLLALAKLMASLGGVLTRAARDNFEPGRLHEIHGLAVAPAAT